MDIQVGGKLVEVDPMRVLTDLRHAFNDRRFGYVKPERNGVIMVSCPFHKDGQERHPSFGITTEEIVKMNKRVPAGSCHCFTCGYKTASFVQFIADCFGSNLQYAEDWLITRYGEVWIEKPPTLLPISNDEEEKFLDPSILAQYSYYHPYMYQRKLTNPIIEKFDIGYDKETNSLTFPVWDINDRLVFITRRNVSNKNFNIPTGVVKPVYLLNYLIKEGATTAYICESQINALTLHTWGYAGVALFGTGDEYQYEQLKKSGIRHFVLCFDGDAAGKHGQQRFLDYFKHDPVFVDVVNIPFGRDVNNLTKEQFETCLANSSEFLKIV